MPDLAWFLAGLSVVLAIVLLNVVVKQDRADMTPAERQRLDDDMRDDPWP